MLKVLFLTLLFLNSGFNTNSYAAEVFNEVDCSFDEFYEEFEKLRAEENEIIQLSFLQAEGEYNKKIIELEQHARAAELSGNTEELRRITLRKGWEKKPSEPAITTAVSENFKTKYLELFIYFCSEYTGGGTNLQNTINHLIANPTSVNHISQKLFQANSDTMKTPAALAQKIRLCWSEPIGQKITETLPVMSHPQAHLYGRIRASIGRINMGWGSAILINSKQILSCRHNFNDGCTYTFFPNAAINPQTGDVNESQGIPITSPTFRQDKEDIAVKVQLDSDATIPENVATIPIHPEFQLAHMEECDTIYVYGYPGDRALTILKSTVKKESITPGPNSNTFVIPCPAVGGVSGSPVILIKADNSQKIIGVALQMDKLDPTRMLFINLDKNHI